MLHLVSKNATNLRSIMETSLEAANKIGTIEVTESLISPY